MRLIDADALKQYFQNGTDGYDFSHWTRADIIDFIDNAPTVQERPKGKWIHDYDDFYKCSLCGRGICTNWENEPTKYYPFCHCGADMRGDKNE